MVTLPSHAGPEVVLGSSRRLSWIIFMATWTGEGLIHLEGEMRLSKVVSLSYGHAANEKPSQDSDLTCLEHGPNLMRCGSSI